MDELASLNSKLVASFTRVGDLEDSLHAAEQEIHSLRSQLSNALAEQAKWEEQIAIGGWVEKTHVQEEMNRLVNTVLEEQKSRESAVKAHDHLETEIENLTSSLFSEANKMVAIERFARARADQKLASLEESNETMENMLQELQASMKLQIDHAESDKVYIDLLVQLLNEHNIPLPETRSDREDSKLSRGTSNAIVALPKPRLITTVLPYTEFLAFVSYLRELRRLTLLKPVEMPITPVRPFGIPAQFSNAPISPTQALHAQLALSSHISQPFLKRCIEEDSDPTIRLDLAPGLGFLSRRTAATAIVDGTLVIEPVSFESSLPSSSCSLCGCSLDQWIGNGVIKENTAVKHMNETMKRVWNTGSWSFNRPKPVSSESSSQLEDPLPKEIQVDLEAIQVNEQTGKHLHVFRISESASSKYVLCPTYCLPRLRAVCEFWNYIRAMERGLLLEEAFQFHPAGHESVDDLALRTRNSSRTKLAVSLSPSMSETNSVQTFKSADSFKEVEETATIGANIVDQAEKSVDKNAQEENSSINLTKVVNSETVDAPQNSENVEEPVEQVTIKTVEESETAKSTENHNSEENDLEKADVDSKDQHKESSNSEKREKPPLPPRSVARKSTPNDEAPKSPTEISIKVDSAPEIEVPNEVRTEQIVNEVPTEPSPTLVRSRGDTITISSTTQVDMGKRSSEYNGMVDAMSIVGGVNGWEDECWAEVVRLKDAMFWARMARDNDS